MFTHTSRRAALATLGSLGTLAGFWGGMAPCKGTAQGRVQSLISYGWRPDLVTPLPPQDGLYVNAAATSPGDGSFAAPFATVQRGVAALARQGRGHLSIRGGLYREHILLDALRGTPDARYSIGRYGAERVVITAADPLLGWSPCPTAEAARIGTSAQDLYVARLPRSALAHDRPEALNLHMGGRPVAFATDLARASRDGATRSPALFHKAVFGVTPDDRITKLQDARLVGLDPAVLKGARVLVFHAPNLVSPVEIASFDPTLGEILLAKENLRLHKRGGREGTPVMLYALENTALGLRADTWMARATTGGEVSVYLRRRSGAGPPRDVEVSARTGCVDFGQAQHVELHGLEIIRASGGRRGEGIALSRPITQTPGAGLRIENCRIGETAFSGPRGQGVVQLSGTTGLVIRNATIGPARGSFGLALSDAVQAQLSNLHLTGVSNSPARFFGVRDSLFAFSLLENSAQDAHANTFNFYEGCDRVLVYAVRARNVGGYVTYQKASRLAFGFCEFPCAPATRNRALVSQNFPAGAGRGGIDGSGAPASGRFLYWNLSLSPDQKTPDPANALQLGPADSAQGHNIHNCLLHGGGFGAVYTKGADPGLERRSHNLYTGLSFWQSDRYGWRMGHAEARTQLSTQRQATGGLDMRPQLQRDWAPVFADFDGWDQDIDGRPIDWSNPPIGCYA